MNLTGVAFALFLPLVLLAHWLGPRRVAWQNAVLLVAGYVFYATWNVRLVPILALATLVDWLVGRDLALHPLEGRDLGPDDLARVRRRRKLALATSLVFNLALLGGFKYVGFFASSLNDLLTAVGLPAALPVLRIALPLGISYYTLQKLAYVIDVYYERVPACRNLLSFATFVAFFPQLIAGPITRARTVLVQFQVPRTLSPDWLAGAGRAFLLGFVMKAFVADWLASEVVNPVFADPTGYDRASVWAGFFGYAIQLFCDFGGLSFMAIGVGRGFGIELPLNFNYPYLSRSLMEIWRRWHITLNTWLFDYLFAPLTTGRSWFRGRIALGFIVVFLTSGLWHGAEWAFVLWGGLHGVALAVSHAYDQAYKRLCRKDRRWVALRRGRPYALAAWFLTQAFFLFTLIPFRSGSVAATGTFLHSLFASSGAARINFTSINLLACVLLFVAYHVLEIGPAARLRDRFASLPAPVRGLVYGLVVVWLLLYVPVGGSTFIYAQF